MRLVVVLSVVIAGCGSKATNEELKGGIAREKVLKHMTTESDTVIFFDEHGVVVSTSDRTVLNVKPAFGMMLDVANQAVPDMKKLKAPIWVSWSADGTGNRFSREKAEAVLDDLIRKQANPTKQQKIPADTRIPKGR